MGSNKIIENLKLSGRFVKHVLPYAISAFLSTGTFLILNKGEVKYLHTNTESDNLKRIRQVQYYDQSETKQDDRLYYYTMWYDNGDGTYSRDAKVYSLSGKSKEDGLDNTNLMESNEEVLAAILGDPIYELVETRNDLTEEEIKKDPEIVTMTYDINKNDYIVTNKSLPETLFHTGVATIFFIIASVNIWDEYTSDHIEKYKALKRKTK